MKEREKIYKYLDITEKSVSIKVTMKLVILRELETTSKNFENDLQTTTLFRLTWNLRRFQETKADLLLLRLHRKTTI